MKDPAWKLAGFIVDDPLTDILAIRCSFYIFDFSSLPVCQWLELLTSNVGHNFIFLESCDGMRHATCICAFVN